MKIKDLEIGKVYYASDDCLDIKTSPKILLLAKEKTQYLFEVRDLGEATNRDKGEIFWKELNSLLLFEDCLFEFDRKLDET